jgi:hypothetical protein
MHYFEIVLAPESEIGDITIGVTQYRGRPGSDSDSDSSSSDSKGGAQFLV